tara:strand:- start:1803 stop:2477 length:675 start_codon:yes stop_codon:yes gene_type:complete
MKRNTRKDSFLSVNLTKANFAVCISIFISLAGIFFAFGQWMARKDNVKIYDNENKEERSKTVFLLKNDRKNESSENERKKTEKTKKEFYQTLKEYRKDRSEDSEELHLERNTVIKDKFSQKKKLLQLKIPKKISSNDVRNRKPILKSAYSLQIASFRKISTADDFLKKLKYKGFSAYIQIADLAQKGKWFRVRVNVPQEKNGLQDLKKRLKKYMRISKFQVIKN